MHRQNESVRMQAVVRSAATSDQISEVTEGNLPDIQVNAVMLLLRAKASI